MPLLRFNEDRCNSNIIPILAPCVELPGKNLSVLDNGKDVNVQHIQWQQAKTDDVFCFSSGDGSISSYEYAIGLAKKIINAGHNVEMHLNCFDYLKIELIDKDFLASEGLIFPSKISDTISTNSSHEKARLKSLTVPVIAVGSIVSENNKKGVCLSLARYFKSKGKKVACIFSDSVYQYLGMHVLDYESLYNGGMNLMIYRINNYFCNVQETTGCDMIICDIPGGLIKYSSEFIDSAGVVAYIISQAINIQKIICCVPLSYNVKQYYEAVADIIRKKYDISEIIFHMSNYLVETKQSPISDRMPGCYVSSSEYMSVLSEVNGSNLFVYDMQDQQQIEVALHN